ncbi:hypothetical protein KIL84_019625 [Mauremys mutica]|uniref:Uncharacterized protein n=1 Tax=Mauremys mutica TaxID=74926 RepID=A0A9D3XWR2_9SAUR|nr:hypothetical protein KIL84_019625 [Mauremys mutica]
MESKFCFRSDSILISPHLIFFLEDEHYGFPPLNLLHFFNWFSLCVSAIYSVESTSFIKHKGTSSSLLDPFPLPSNYFQKLDIVVNPSAKESWMRPTSEPSYTASSISQRGIIQK